MASKQQIAEINKLMLQLIGNYATNYADDLADADMLQMYADDIAHNIAALQAFNKTQDAQKLWHSIMQQDTLPREYFADVLVLLEDEELVACSSY